MACQNQRPIREKFSTLRACHRPRRRRFREVFLRFFFENAGAQFFSKNRSRRCDRFRQIFVKIGAILAIFRPFEVCQGGPPRQSDAISIESKGISNRPNRKSQKSSNGQKIARMAQILTIFGRNSSSQRNLSFQNFSNDQKIIKSIESIDPIGRSTDRLYRSKAAVFALMHCFCKGSAS